VYDDENQNEDDNEEDHDDECEDECEDDRGEAWEEYKESIRELKDQYRGILDDWRNRIGDWKDQMKERATNGSFSHFALPPVPPIPPIPPMHTHLMSVGRANVVASRIGDGDLRLIDMLMEAGIFNTRSEAVAYLVSEGIKARRDTFEKVSTSLDEIRKTRKEAENQIEKLRQEIGFKESREKTKTDGTDEPNKTDGANRQEDACPKCRRKLSDSNSRFCPNCGTRLEKED
jgi:hypothetical protein